MDKQGIDWRPFNADQVIVDDPMRERIADFLEGGVRGAAPLPSERAQRAELPREKHPGDPSRLSAHVLDAMLQDTPLVRLFERWHNVHRYAVPAYARLVEEDARTQGYHELKVVNPDEGEGQPGSFRWGILTLRRRIDNELRARNGA